MVMGIGYVPQLRSMSLVTIRRTKLWLKVKTRGRGRGPGSHKDRHARTPVSPVSGFQFQQRSRKKAAANTDPGLEARNLAVAEVTQVAGDGRDLNDRQVSRLQSAGGQCGFVSDVGLATGLPPSMDCPRR